ncbi:repetitive organellar protein-like [Hemibagrus wyckioides]|uniref:repetitive organellar protein-like n=1 Tax=Hemibagrus wyckioides TaxID=337641 RepID=UPI00266D8382|nr:repetitive organellar protein-like [Hemibagrus wyckioides]
MDDSQTGFSDPNDVQCLSFLKVIQILQALTMSESGVDLKEAGLFFSDRRLNWRHRQARGLLLIQGYIHVSTFSRLAVGVVTAKPRGSSVNASAQAAILLRPPETFGNVTEGDSEFTFFLLKAVYPSLAVYRVNRATMLHLISLAGTGIYYLIKKRRDGEKTAEQTDTPATEDPVQTGSLLDPGLKCDDETQTDSAVPQGSVSEAEEKSQKGEVSSSLLDSERSILEERVRELEELLCEAERERERKHKVTPAECEEKHKQATESAEQMQKQDADLKSQVDTLKDTVQELGLLLTEKHTECADTTRLYETELNLRTRVQSECKQKEEMFNQETRSLRVALNEAERKYEQVMESNAQLEIKNSRLWSDVRLMQDAMLDEERSLTRIHCNDMKTECELKKRELNSLQSKQNEMEETSLKECEREKEAHSVLKCDQMTSTHHEELLQECERDEKHHSVLKCDQMTSTQDMELLQVSFIFSCCHDY